jgi:hypothetical protein
VFFSDVVAGRLCDLAPADSWRRTNPHADSDPNSHDKPDPDADSHAPTPVGQLYVTSGSQSSIIRFANAFSANGNVSPAATISGATTTLASPVYLALDSSADRLFVANRASVAVLIFDQASTKTGNAAPTRTITGSATGLFVPIQSVLDKTRDLLYVTDDLDVLVFTSASTARRRACRRV